MSPSSFLSHGLSSQTGDGRNATLPGGRVPSHVEIAIVSSRHLSGSGSAFWFWLTQLKGKGRAYVIAIKEKGKRHSNHADKKYQNPLRSTYSCQFRGCRLVSVSGSGSGWSGFGLLTLNSLNNTRPRRPNPTSCAASQTLCPQVTDSLRYRHDQRNVMKHNPKRHADPSSHKNRVNETVPWQSFSASMMPSQALLFIVVPTAHTFTTA